MKREIEQSKLTEALSYCAIKELPEEDNGENVWIKALGIVSKRDGTSSFVALERDKNGENKVVKDFGSVSQIVKIEKVFPYLYLESFRVPTFDSNSKEVRIEWLKYHDIGVDHSNDSLKMLNKAILNVVCHEVLKNKI